MPRIRSQDGLGLVEALIFVAVLAIVTLGVTSFLISSGERSKQLDVVETMTSISNFATREVFNSRTLFWSVNRNASIPTTLNSELYRCIMRDGVSCGSSTFYAMLVPGIPAPGMYYPTQRFAGYGSAGWGGDYNKRIFYNKDGTLCPVGAQPTEQCPIEVSVSMVCADEGCASMDRVGYLRVTLRIETVWSGIGVPEGIKPIVRTEMVKIEPPKGTIISWGENASGEIGDGTSTQRNAPVYISSVNNAVEVSANGHGVSCAVLDTGGVSCWGEGMSATPDTIHNLVRGVKQINMWRDFGCYLSTIGAVKCWGVNTYGQLGDGTSTDSTDPVDVTGLNTGVVSISVGSSHACALNTSGAVKCWGRNHKGQLGDASTNDSATPVAASGLGSGVAQLEAKMNNTCIVTTSGGAKCWGENATAQIGDGSSTQRSSPTNVTGLTTGVMSISPGGNFTCALTTSGGIKCWGKNDLGQVGNGATSADVSGATDVTGLTSNAVQVTAMGNHACALKSDGSVRCWGGGVKGEIGDGTSTDRYSQTLPTGLASNIIQVNAGRYHNLAITATSDTSTGTGTGTGSGTGSGTGAGVDGAALGWGNGSFNANGDAGAANRTSPDNIPTLTANIQQIMGGINHACALTTGGGVKCWGQNSTGQVGDGTSTNRASPVDVTGLTSGVVQIAIAGDHSCALTSGGAMKCWGRNEYGELGDNTTTPRSTAVTVTGMGSGISAIGVGEDMSCAVTTGGAAKCWGSGANGRLGNGATTDQYTPVDVSGLTSGIVEIVASGAHACARNNSGGMKCWGYNGHGELGDGTSTDRTTPVDVGGLTSGVAAMGAREFNTCALTSTGGVKCWGYNSVGQVGNGASGTDITGPVNVTGLTSGVAEIAVGGYHACALTTGGAMKCWGLNNTGQVGDGTTTNRNTPVDVNYLSSNVLKIGPGHSHSFAIRTTPLTGTGSGTGTGTGSTAGYAYCWGYNGDNQAGIGNIFTPITRLMPVDGLDAGGASPLVTDVMANLENGCALTATGAVKCWGEGLLGDGPAITEYRGPVQATGLTSSVTQLTSGLWNSYCAIHSNTMKCWGSNLYLDGVTKGSYDTPTAVTGLGNVSSIAISGQENGNTMCAVLTSSGGLKCWGFNDMFGQVGDGTTNERFAPVDVTGLTSGVTSASLGREHNCALTTGGAVKCWGRNQYYQLGDGTTNTSMTAVQVTGLTSGVSQLVTGFDHSCVLVSGGVKCWGRNNDGQLGDGSSTDRSSPVDVTGLTSGVIQISAGNHQTCAIKSDNTSYCWGNFYLGNSGSSGSASATAVQTYGTTALKINATRGDSPTGESGTNCLVSSTAPPTAYWKAWGENSNSELQDGGTTDRSRISKPYFNPTLYLASPPATVSVGENTNMFLAATTNDPWGWGLNTYGQVGMGASAPAPLPVLAPGVTATSPKKIDIFQHTCALHTPTSKISCWGRNQNGQLGDGTSTDRGAPAFATDYSLAKYIDVDVGQTHSCGITFERYLRCWGRNNHGQLGLGNSTDTAAPLKITSTQPFFYVSAGKDATCMIETMAGTAMCFGEQHMNGAGLGVDATIPVPVLPNVPPPYTSISVGETHACASSIVGSVMCWGNNTYGQLGDGTSTNSDPPVVVTGLSNVLEVVAGVDATCARISDGTVKCWGRNNSGQLGNGTSTTSASPVTVSGLSNVTNLGRGNGRAFFARVGTICSTTGSPFGGGSGTSGDPYLICSATQFGNISTASSSYFKITRDLNLAGLSWTPITSFSGTVDGDGHRLYGLALTHSGTSGVGLFAKTLASGGTLTNLIFAGNQLVLGANQGANAVGGLIGTMSAGSVMNNVTNSNFTLNANGKSAQKLGGLAGTCAGTITGGSHNITINGVTDVVTGPVGGLVGDLTGSIAQVHLALQMNVALAAATATPIYGGIAGQATGGQITESVVQSSAFTVAASAGVAITAMGGIVGAADATSTLRRVKISGPMTIGPNITAVDAGGLFGVASCAVSDAEMAASISFGAATTVTNFGAIGGSFTTASGVMNQVMAIGGIDNVNGTLTNYKGHIGACDGLSTFSQVLRSPTLMVRAWGAGCATGVTDTYECASCAGTVKDGSCAGAAHDFSTWTATHWTTTVANSTCAAYPRFNLDR